MLHFALVGELPGERWLSATDEHADLFALAGAGLLAADVLLPIPSSIVGTMLGARLGFGAGLTAAFVGMMAGQCAAYVASRWLFHRRGDDLLPAPTLVALFLSRPVPLLAEADAVAAGAARLGWAQFLLACGSGNLIYAAALALNGSRLMPTAPSGAGLLLPVAAWLVWRAARQPSDRGD